MSDDIKNMTDDKPVEEPEITVVASGETDRKPASTTKVSARGTFAGIFLAVLVILVIVAAFLQINRTQQRANEAQTRMARGQAAVIEGDMDLALFQFTEALNLDPNLPGANRSLGLIALANGRGVDGGAEAGRHFEAELAINPDDRLSHLALGCLNVLGIVGAADIPGIRPYLIGQFQNVLPAQWSPELQYEPTDDVHPLTKSIYHFHYASERLPADPAPIVGLSLAHLANNDIYAAREKLSRLVIETTDENAISTASALIDDLNELEIYLAYIGTETPETDTSTVPDETSPPRDYSSELEPLESIAGAPDEYRPPWETGPDPYGSSNRGYGDDLTLQVTQEDLIPQPTVKPISHDIHLEETDEWIHTVRIANIYQRGSLTFREGEIIVMPNTNTEVRVMEAEDNMIVLEENGETYTWVPGDVGWVLVRQSGEMSLSEAESMGILPVPESDNGETEEPDSGDDLGPEVPSEN